jgi:hypothetical protein
MRRGSVNKQFTISVPVAENEGFVETEWEGDGDEFATDENDVLAMILTNVSFRHISTQT